MDCRVAVTVLAILLAGCGSVSPVAEPILQPLADPPQTTIHGVSGRPISWCGWGGCNDGFVNDAAFLPAATPPYLVELPAGARIERAAAYLPRTETQQDVTQLEVEGVLLIGVPDEAEWICVSLRWPRESEGDDATYCWATADAGV